MNIDTKFYDTSALILGYQTIFDSDEIFAISSITLKELEDIKQSNKSEETKYIARYITKWLKDNQDRYDVVIYTVDYDDIIHIYNLPLSNDTKILACAYHYEKSCCPDELIFVTNDLSLYNMANLFFGNECVQVMQPIQEEEYNGYIEIVANEQQLATLYENPCNNIFNLLNNQYLIIRDRENNIQDIRVWRNEEYKHISEPIFKSIWFGSIKPYNGDIYQKCLFDSLNHNTITMVRGKAGSGKSLISLAFLFYKLEKHEIDKIIIFCNPVATINSAKLGYTPGDLISKLLDTQIGNILISKLGDRYAVEQLINENKLLLLPLSNARGFDTTGMRAGIYISEAQNLDKELMKLALQRIGEDCICIIDGDDNAQVDLPQFDGKNNGMKKASQVFRNKNIYGEVKLQNIYRSEIGKIAQEM